MESWEQGVQHRREVKGADGKLRDKSPGEAWKAACHDWSRRVEGTRRDDSRGRRELVGYLMGLTIRKFYDSGDSLGMYLWLSQVSK